MKRTIGRLSSQPQQWGGDPWTKPRSVRLAASLVQKEVRHRLVSHSLGVPPEEIVGLSEIAEMLGVTKRTVARYRTRADFPEPLARLRAGYVWKRADVEKWAKATLPLPRTGRPPKPPTS